MLDHPLTLPCGLTLPNRLAKASMTEALADEQGDPSEGLQRLFSRYATGGAGALLTGNVVVDALHPVRPGDVVVSRTSSLAAWRAWADAGKAGGARMFVQVNHAGRQTMRFVNPQPLAPSAVAVRALGAFGRPRAASEAEIEALIGRYVEAAVLAEAAGFDGAQIHAAHGYLLSQFLSPRANLRQDGWGGDVAGRARMLLEILRQVRRRVRPGFALLVKLNSADFQRGGFTEDQALQVVRLLEGVGVDLLELSGGTYERAASFGHGVSASTASREAYFLEFARRVRSVSSLPIMLTGGFRTRGAMVAALQEGALDVIGLARPLALEPGLPRRLLAGEEVPVPQYPRTFSARTLDGAAELAWYSEQLRRMSVGLEPDPTLPPARTLIAGTWRDFWRARRIRAAHRPVQRLLPAAQA